MGAVAVKEDDEVIGVFSERDLMLRVVRKGLDPQAVAVREVMSHGCLKVSVNEDYRIAKMHMIDRKVRHLAVTDDDDRFLGLISMRDMIEMDVKEYADLVSKLNDRYYQVALKTEKR
jgi:CBS domain-containing protein